MTRRLFFSLSCLSALMAASCGQSTREVNAASMNRRLTQCEALELVAPAGAIGARAERSLLRWCGVLGIPLERVDPQRGVSENPRIVVGSFKDPQTRSLIESTGARVTAEGGLEWVGRKFEGAGVAWVATFEDPQRAGLPITLFAGSTLDALGSLALDLRPVARPGARIFRRGRMVLAVRLSADGTPDEESIIDYEERWSEFERGLEPLPIARSPFSVRYQEGVGPAAALAWAERARVTADHIQRWAGAPPKRIQVALTDQLEDVQALHGVCRFGVPEPERGTVLAVQHPALPEDGRRSLAQAQLVRTIGFPVIESDWMLEAAAVDAVDSWWGRDLEEWWTYLTAQGLFPSPRLMSTSGALLQRSVHIRLPARAALFRYLRETLGADQLVRIWSGEESYTLGDAVLKDFQVWLLERTDPGTEAVRAKRAAHLEAVRGVRRRRGVAIDSPLDTQRSFVVPELAQTLDRAVALGVDALSVQCYWLEDGPQPSFAAGAGPRLGGFVEPDAELAHILGLARERGMGTCLVPVQLVSSGAGRSAWLRRTSAPAWRDFFIDQRRMLEHAGLMAELMGVELLSLGSELGNATNTRIEAGLDLPEEIFETKREEWSKSIAFARAVFSGGLTYGALWKRELEQIEFWSELDFIGLVYYPRLGTPLGERPSDRSIQGSMTKVLRAIAAKGEEEGLPVLLLEVGFPSSARAWWDTSLGQGELDLDEQERLYTSFAGALESVVNESDRVRGTYLWRWEIEPGSGGARDRGFSPQGKPAEAVLSRMYR